MVGALTMRAAGPSPGRRTPRRRRRTAAEHDQQADRDHDAWPRPGRSGAGRAVPREPAHRPGQRPEARHGGSVAASRMPRSERPPASASVPVRAAAARQSRKSQPAERTVPTPISATVAAAQASRSAPLPAPGPSDGAENPSPGGRRRDAGEPAAAERTAMAGAGSPGPAISAAVPASAATSQPSPGRISGSADRATTAAAEHGHGSGWAAPVGPGQRRAMSDGGRGGTGGRPGLGTGRAGRGPGTDPGRSTRPVRRPATVTPGMPVAAGAVACGLDGPVAGRRAAGAESGGRCLGWRAAGG